MTDVRALTLHQPWASLVAVGAKSIETRGWETKHRGRLLIHAGMWKSQAQVDAANELLLGWGREDVMFGGSFVGGAVVASCTLTDCVPIVKNGHGFQAWSDGRLMRIVGGSVNDEDHTDQRPFGDFSPGRWAWLLDDVKPTTERCPRCWGDKIARTHSGLFYDGPCPTCRGDGVCDPVPMRGRQGLFRPEWPA